MTTRPAPTLPGYTYDKLIETIERVRTDVGPEHTGELDGALRYLRTGEMRVGEAARALGVRSNTTIKNWIRLGRFPGAHQTPGGQWLLPTASVMALRDASLAADAMTASGRLRQETYTGDPFGDLDL